MNATRDPLPARWHLIVADDRPRDSTIRMPVKLADDGRLEVLGLRKLPHLRSAARLELRLPASELVDDAERTEWLRESEVVLFHKAESLRVRVRPRQLTRALRPHAIRETRTTDPNASFVVVQLREPLRLVTRASGISKLAPATCSVPSLGRHAKSLNEAYRLVSEAFEPHRRSHSANVFLEVFYDDQGWWIPIDAYRTWVELENAPLRIGPSHPE